MASSPEALRKTSARVLAAVRLRPFVGSTRATAAVEFAFILPILVFAYLGMVELYQGWTLKGKTAQLAETLANLAGRTPGQLNQAQIADIFLASTALLAPYNDSTPQMKIANIVVDAQGQASITWGCAKNTSKPATGQVTLPTGLNQAGTSLIRAEVTVPFTPTIGHFITGSIDFDNTQYISRGGEIAFLNPNCT